MSLTRRCAIFTKGWEKTKTKILANHIRKLSVFIEISMINIFCHFMTMLSFLWLGSSVRAWPATSRYALNKNNKNNRIINLLKTKEKHLVGQETLFSSAVFLLELSPLFENHAAHIRMRITWSILFLQVSSVLLGRVFAKRGPQSGPGYSRSELHQTFKCFIAIVFFFKSLLCWEDGLVGTKGDCLFFRKTKNHESFFKSNLTILRESLANNTQNYYYTFLFLFFFGVFLFFCFLGSRFDICSKGKGFLRALVGAWGFWEKTLEGWSCHVTAASEPSWYEPLALARRRWRSGVSRSSARGRTSRRSAWQSQVARGSGCRATCRSSPWGGRQRSRHCGSLREFRSISHRQPRKARTCPKKENVAKKAKRKIRALTGKT